MTLPLTDREIYRRAALDCEIALNAILDALDRLQGRSWAGRLDDAAETIRAALAGLIRDSKN